MRKMQIPTPLLSLDPIGIGTAMAESLDSYMHRIALAHMVRRERVDLLIESGERYLLNPLRTTAVIKVDTPNEKSQMFGQRLAGLTGRPQVERLGLGIFSGILSCAGIRRAFRSWCPECVRLADKSGDEPYWPLVWSFSDYVVCHTHGSGLVSNCPSCGHSNGCDRSWKGRLHHCPSCDQFLGTVQERRAARRTRLSTKTREVDSYNFVASRVLAEFVSSIEAIHMNSFSLSNNFDQLVRHVGETRGKPATASTIVRLAGMSKSTGHSLAHSKLLPSMRIMVQLAVRFNISLAGLMCPALWRTDAFSDHNIQTRKRRRTYVRRDWEQIRSLFRQAALNETPLSPTAFSKQINVCPQQLIERLSLDGKKLLLARKNVRDTALASQAEQLALKITSVEAEFQALGIAISNRKLAATLNFSRSCRLYKMARALTLKAK